MASIRDVAEQAGLSVASVSRVLSGLPGVSEATRQRVMMAVEALGYRPNLAARRLRSQRTDTLGLIVSDIRNPYFTEVSRAVEDVAYAHGMRVMFCNTDENPEKENFYLEMMRDENVAGVILSPTLDFLAHPHQHSFPFPLVLVDRCESDTATDAAVLDNEDAAQRLIRHLLEEGYRRIVFFYGAASATGRQRLAMGPLAGRPGHRRLHQSRGERLVCRALEAPRRHGRRRLQDRLRRTHPDRCRLA